MRVIFNYAGQKSADSIADVAKTAERIWSLERIQGYSQALGHVPGLTVDQEVLAAEIRAAKKASRAKAREIWESLPGGTVLIGQTARVWHTGCPHSQPSVRRLGIVGRRADGFLRREDAWFSFLSDGGVENSDNGREPAVHIGEEWELLAGKEPTQNRKGWERDYLPESNLFRQGGDYPAEWVVFGKLGGKPRPIATAGWLGEYYLKGTDLDPQKVLERIQSLS